MLHATYDAEQAIPVEKALARACHYFSVINIYRGEEAYDDFVKYHFGIRFLHAARALR